MNDSYWIYTTPDASCSSFTCSHVTDVAAIGGIILADLASKNYLPIKPAFIHGDFELAGPFFRSNC